MNLARHVTCGATCTQSYKKVVNTCYAGCSAHIPSVSSRLHSRSVLPWLPSIRAPISDCSTSGAARSQVVARSFLGVGAPEALLVGVVALVVFGPKGLAEAAKSVGQTLRAFQPTIREVVEVSQDIKGTLEKELGLNEIREASRSAFTPTSSLTASRAGVARSSFDDLVAGASTSTASASQQGNGTAGDNISSSSSLDGQGGAANLPTGSPSADGRISSGGRLPAELEGGFALPAPGPRSVTAAQVIDPDIEAKRRASAAAAWGQAPASVASTGSAARPTASVAELTMDELEAELAKRRAAAAARSTDGGSA